MPHKPQNFWLSPPPYPPRKALDPDEPPERAARRSACSGGVSVSGHQASEAPPSLLEHTAEPREGEKGSILSSPVVQRFLFRRPPMYILFDAFAPPVGLPLRRRRVLCCPWWPPCYYYIRLLLRLRQLPPPLSPPPPPLLLLLLLRRRYFKCFPICGMAHLSTHLRRSK